MMARILVLLVAVCLGSAEAQTTKRKTTDAKKSSATTATAKTSAKKEESTGDQTKDETSKAKAAPKSTASNPTVKAASADGTPAGSSAERNKSSGKTAPRAATAENGAASKKAPSSVSAGAGSKGKSAGPRTANEEKSNGAVQSTTDAQKSSRAATKLPVSRTTNAPASLPTLDRPPQDNAGEEPTRLAGRIGPNVTLDPEDLANFDRNSAAVRRLLMLGLELTRRDLTYRYGSSDPSTGGMDCSGTIYYLLKAAGIKDPPRDSSGLYLWAQREGTLREVRPTSLDEPAMADLRPGDLLFWEGTYEVQRDPPISHTMIYLGREKKTGVPVMVGASDGRTYAGIRRNGVSVFDFRLPRAGSSAVFVGYGRVPGL
jgi:peptidoglycan DL-endopeptidase CwlO